MSRLPPLAVPVDLSPAAAVAAVRDPADDRVCCTSPGPAHDDLGRLPPREFDRRRAFAAAARSLGERPPNADALADARTALASLDPPAPGTDGRSVTSEDTRSIAELREHVARLQGRLRERRDRGLDTEGIEAELRAATRALSEAETRRIASDEAAVRDRERNRTAFDARERRLELEDRVGNLERAARAALADRVRPAVETALERLPCADRTLEDAADVTIGFAVARVARFDAPLVLASPGPFPNVAAAARWLRTDVCYPVRS